VKRKSAPGYDQTRIRSTLPVHPWSRAISLWRQLDGAKITRRGFPGPTIGFDLERDFLTLVETIHARALNGTNVNEHIFAAVARLDETKAFLAVEPLYSSLHHNNSFRLSARSTALSHGLFKSSFGKIISPTQSARRGQVVSAKLDRIHINASLPEYKWPE
jgi:hypothetical protein